MAFQATDQPVVQPCPEPDVVRFLYEIPCLPEVARGKLTLSERIPVVQRWWGEIPEVWVPPELRITIGPVPTAPVTTAQSPEPFDWHQLSRI